MIKIIDCFSGSGGFSKGVAQALGSKAQHVLGIEWDRHAANTYRYNFDAPVYNENIWDVIKDPERFPIPQADWVIGGPPCQGFSVANQNKPESDPRNELWAALIEVVCRSNASVFVIENVPNFLKSKEFQMLIGVSEELGFTLEYNVLNAAQYGAPQARKRAIIIGNKLGLTDLLPVPTHGPGEVFPFVTVKDAINDLPYPTSKPQPPDWLNYVLPIKPYYRDLVALAPNPGDGIEKVIMGQPDDLLSACHLRLKHSGKKLGAGRIGRRLLWEAPSFTLTTDLSPSQSALYHPFYNRLITLRERARLMGYPDNFIFTGSKGQIARQIGNSVCPPLASAIAARIFQQLHYGLPF